MEQYKYRPIRFYFTCFVATWSFWIAAAILSRTPNDNGLSTLLMLFGLIAPSITAITTVLASGCKALKQDLKRKIIGFYRIKPFNILLAILLFAAVVHAVWRGAETVFRYRGFFFFGGRYFCSDDNLACFCN